VKYYGAEPPWAGAPQFGYAWQRGLELWDGTTEWALVYRGRGYGVAQLGNSLRDFYLAPITKQLNSETLLGALMQDIEEVTASPRPLKQSWRGRLVSSTAKATHLFK
jgi:hypothetical protein